MSATTFGPVELGATVLSTTAKRACAIRVSGATKHLVCADNADMAHEYAITVSAGKTVATQVGAAVNALPTPPLALGYPGSIWPWLYPLYYVALLVPRQLDDDRRCAAKYGALWDEYVRTVRWRIVPWVY